MTEITVTRHATRLARLTDELKRLIGCGALPEHLAGFVPIKVAGEPEHRQPKFPLLWSLYAPTDTAGLSRQAVGEIMQAHLHDALINVPEPWHFRPGLLIPENQNPLFLTFLFGISSYRDSATRRRQDAIDALGGGWEVDGWRRPNGDERKLCQFVAIFLLADADSSE